MRAKLAQAAATEEIANQVLAARQVDGGAEQVARQARQDDLPTFKEEVRRLLAQAVRESVIFFRGTVYQLGVGERAGEAVRAWGRLGYPRRALRLHSAAGVITDRHAGRVPLDLADLRSLPGVGEYTAAAIASFAHRQRHVVLDTNVRRVLSRAFNGCAQPAQSLRAAERTRAAALLPDDAQTAARWSVSVMELGALVCAPSKPACSGCPLVESCAWRAAGYPPSAVPGRRSQPYDGTDRQCRGRLLALLRTSPGAVARPSLAPVWSDAEQRERALDGLVADGLIEPLAGERFGLPGLCSP